MAKTSQVKNSHPKWQIGLLVLNIAVLVGLAALSFVLFQKYQDAKTELTLTQEQRNEKLVAEVAKVYSLPKDEKPVVALVADEEKFKQEYKVFTDAKKDDQLLLYEKAALAVLYRPSEKKVIATAPLAINKQYNVALVGPEEQTAAAEKTLTEKAGSNVKVVSKTVGITTYPATIIVDVNGTQGAAAEQLATIIGGATGSLPAGETAPEGSDIVIYVASQ